MKAPPCLSPYRLAFSRAEDLRQMVAASADPADCWHYCHADNVAALEQAEKELAAIIAAEKSAGKTLDPVTLQWVKASPSPLAAQILWLATAGEDREGVYYMPTVADWHRLVNQAIAQN